MTRAGAVIGAAAVVIALAVALGARGPGDPATLEDRVQQVASGLRCPVCQNLSVADSPSRLAGEMRDEIATRLRAGADADEVRAFFVQRYGDWVLLEPPRSGFNVIAWVVPFAALLAGVALWLILIRRRPRELAEEAA